MKYHDVRREIDGVWYWCRDVGCDDFDRARFNRGIGHLYLTGYIEVEEALEHIPISKPLPSWIPRGKLPQIGMV